MSGAGHSHDGKSEVIEDDTTGEQLIAKAVHEMEETVETLYGPDGICAPRLSKIRPGVGDAVITISARDSDDDSASYDTGSEESGVGADEEQDDETEHKIVRKKRARNLKGVMRAGRTRVQGLVGRLHTQQRITEMTRLNDWFKKRAPIAEREVEDLGKREHKYDDDEERYDLDELNLIQDANLRIFRDLEDFKSRLNAQASGDQSFDVVEAVHQEAGASLEKAQAYEKDLENLERAEKALEEVKVQMEYFEKQELADHHGMTEQDEEKKIADLEAELVAKRKEVHDLTEAGEQKAHWNAAVWHQLQDYSRGDKRLPQDRRKVADLMMDLREEIRKDRMDDMRMAVPGIEAAEALQQDERDAIQALTERVEVLDKVGDDEEQALAVLARDDVELAEDDLDFEPGTEGALLKTEFSQVQQAIADTAKRGEQLAEMTKRANEGARAMLAARESVEKQLEKVVNCLLEEEAGHVEEEQACQLFPPTVWQQRLQSAWKAARPGPKFYARFLEPEEEADIHGDEGAIAALAASNLELESEALWDSFNNIEATLLLDQPEDAQDKHDADMAELFAPDLWDVADEEHLERLQELQEETNKLSQEAERVRRDLQASAPKPSEPPRFSEPPKPPEPTGTRMDEWLGNVRSSFASGRGSQRSERSSLRSERHSLLDELRDP